MGRILTSTRKDKCPVRPPMDHFKRLLEEACQNHAYPIKHKLKGCGMMRSFMTSGSLTWGVEHDEGPDGSSTTSFPKENALMMIYGGQSPSGRCHMSSLSPGPQLTMDEDTWAQGCNDTSFPPSK
jgi:hypothetical protein